MSCILCLKTDKFLSASAIKIFSDEAINLDVKGILMQHFWFEPKEDDSCTIICEECWKYLFEFHSFYVRVQQAHQCKKEMIFELGDDNLKQSNEEIPSKGKQGDSLEESPIDASATDDTISDDVLFCQEDPHYRNTRSGKRQNDNKSEDHLFKSKRCRGRPPKSPKKHANNLEISTNEEDVTPNSESNSTKKSFSRRDLSQYDSFISENIKLNCAVCKENCENFTVLQAHFRKEHQMGGYVICCGKKLLKRGVLVDHLYTHKDPEYFKCTECGKVLADRRCLELHQQNHQEKGEPTFKCEICSKAFHLQRVYRIHIESHTPDDLKQFKCIHCSKRYASTYLLNNHVSLVHLNKYSRVCDICGKKIIGSEAFRVHQEQHKGMKQELLGCNICGATTKTKYDLARHKKIKHTEEYQQPQQCKYCSKISPNMLALKRHVYYMHNLKRTHKCSMCEKSFKRVKDLKEHFSTHTGDVLYFCTFCPRTFNSNANMYSHRKKKHPQEWAQCHKEKALNPPAEISLEEELTTLLE